MREAGEVGMIDREKVIRGLECIISSGNAGMRDDCANCIYPGGGDCLAPALRDALALLQAQEPVKPILDIDTWNCGNCGHTLEHQQLLGDNVLFHEQYNFCPECGRAVKWNV